MPSSMSEAPQFGGCRINYPRHLILIRLSNCLHSTDLNFGLVGAMVANKKLRAEVDELRAELSSLRNQREDSATSSSTEKSENKSKTTKPGAPDEQDGETGNLEQMLKDMAEIGEKEIAEHPTIAVGLAFILGVLVGRVTKA